MLIIWIVSPVFIADFLSALAMISCKGLSFLCWSWRDFLFLSMPTQHASWLLGKLNLYQLLFIVMLQLAVGIACMHQRVQLLTQLHWSLEGFPLVIWKVCWGWAMLTCDQKNWRGKGWARVLDGPWFGACFDYFWLIESCYLLIEQVHSVLTPHS